MKTNDNNNKKKRMTEIIRKKKKEIEMKVHIIIISNLQNHIMFDLIVIIKIT